jgi:hypothetical protein
LMQREHGFSFHQVPSGKEITNLVQGGSSGCFSQLPFLSPDGRWMVSETLRCDASLVSYIFTNVEQGTQQIFAKSSVDQIDFVGWKADSSAFYLISRPLKLRAQAAQRTPFGLLELNPLTGQFRRLSDQVWFAAFPRDQNRQFTPFDSTNPNLKQAWLDSFPRDVTRAFFAFPVKSTDGSMHLEGGLWQMGSGKMGSSQVLSHTIPENLSIIDPQNDAGWMLEDSGEEIGYSAQVVHPPLPGVWSNDGQRLATINENHELVILNKDGSVQTVGRATTNPEESNWTFRGIISWSDDDHDITVAEEEWPVP